MGNLGSITAGRNYECPDCGRVYATKWEKVGIKEEGSFRCGCGYVFRWKSASIGEFTLSENPNNMSLNTP
jgi:hypothetical protein